MVKLTEAFPNHLLLPMGSLEAGQGVILHAQDIHLIVSVPRVDAHADMRGKIKSAQAEESEEGKVRDLRRAEAHVSRWALDSAARQGEMAVMFLNPITRRDEQDDHYAVVYAKGAASAALFFLDVDAEESGGTHE